MHAVERGKQMKALREAARLTQDQAGDLVGVKKSAVSEWERGKSSPSWHRLRALDEGYGAGGALLALFGDETGLSMLSDVLARLERLVRAHHVLSAKVQQLGALQGVDVSELQAVDRDLGQAAR